MKNIRHCAIIGCSFFTLAVCASCLQGDFVDGLHDYSPPAPADVSGRFPAETNDNTLIIQLTVGGFLMANQQKAEFFLLNGEPLANCDIERNSDKQMTLILTSESDKAKLKNGENRLVIKGDAFESYAKQPLIQAIKTLSWTAKTSNRAGAGSDDGIQFWDRQVFSIAYGKKSNGGPIYIAVGGADYGYDKPGLSTSIDGKTWTNFSLSIPLSATPTFYYANPHDRLLSICYGGAGDDNNPTGKYFVTTGNWGQMVCTDAPEDESKWVNVDLDAPSSGSVPGGPFYSSAIDKPWTTLPTLNEVRFLNGHFYAVGEFGTIIRTKEADPTAPENWELVNTGVITGAFTGWNSAPELRSITYNGNKYYAVGQWGNIITSIDGKTWKRNITGLGGDPIFRIVYSAEQRRMVAVCEGGNILYSADGTSWNSAESPFGGKNIYDITYGKDRFIAVGDNGLAAFSLDGIRWSLITVEVPQEAFLKTVCYGDRFITAGNYYGDVDPSIKNLGIFAYSN